MLVLKTKIDFLQEHVLRQRLVEKLRIREEKLRMEMLPCSHDTEVDRRKATDTLAASEMLGNKGSRSADLHFVLQNLCFSVVVLVFLCCCFKHLIFGPLLH